ncbi:hypothetical protein Tco_0025939 [Tanacetum coccineum]
MSGLPSDVLIDIIEPSLDEEGILVFKIHGVRLLNCYGLKIVTTMNPCLFALHLKDELSSDYKVVITEIEPKMDTPIIYSLKSGKWKEISHFPCALPLYDGKLLNGSLHWVAGDYSTSLDSWKIISLDLAKETYGEILQPEYEDGKPLLRFGLQLLIYDSKGSSSSVIENKCYDACIVVESLASPFPPLGLADNNSDED